ncbi:hypothetical protein OAQ47_00015 [Paracoccaceae bacterium]|nr:hypothetical protein [Paracoccaceae bacterium]
MYDQFRLDGRLYRTSDFSNQGLSNIALIAFTDMEIKLLINSMAVASRSRSHYITKIKDEIVSRKLGIDLSSLIE